MNVKHDKAAVLKKGLGMFCEKGYNTLGIDEICRVTGMTKGAFYNAFKSKEQFLTEAIQLYSDNNVLRINRELAPKGNATAFERLQQFYFKMLEVQPACNYSGCFINNTMSELGAANAPIGEITALEYARFIDAIEPTVAEAQQAGDMKTDVGPRETAELLHAAFYGILTILKSSKNSKQGISAMTLLFEMFKT